MPIILHIEHLGVYISLIYFVNHVWVNCIRITNRIFYFHITILKSHFIYFNFNSVWIKFQYIIYWTSLYQNIVWHLYWKVAILIRYRLVMHLSAYRPNLTVFFPTASLLFFSLKETFSYESVRRHPETSFLSVCPFFCPSVCPCARLPLWSCCEFVASASVFFP